MTSSTPPSVNTFAQFAPLLIQKYESYLPTAFDESLSLLQKVNKVINSLNTLGDNFNSVVDQWNEAITWVEGDGLTNAVDSLLQTWESDGTLEGLINQELNTLMNEIYIYASSYNVVADGVTDCGVFINNAITDAYNQGGGIVLLPVGKIVSTVPIIMKEGVYLLGQGVGQWEPIFPERPKTWEGTTIIFKGSPSKTFSFTGVTSMKNSGGVRVNGGDTLSLTSFMNSDAVGTNSATPKLYSVAIAPEVGAMYWGVRNLRIIPWKGTDGFSAYSNQGDSSLSDSWDIGLLLNDSEYVNIENVQVVGEWREFGHLNISAGYNSVGRSEQNKIIRSKFQGRVGMGIRSSDRWSVTGLTSSTVSIYFSNESYWKTSGNFEGSDGAIYTYSSLTQSGNTLTFNGVLPNPQTANIFDVRNANNGTGFANTLYNECYTYGFDHVNGQTADYYGIQNSKALEMSGYPMRGIKFTDCKWHTREKTIFFLHDNTDTVMIDPQFEGTGYLIASPYHSDATGIVAPVGETRNLVLLADVGTQDGNTTLFTPRTALIQSSMLAPRNDLTGDFIITALRSNKHTVINHQPNGNFIVRSSNGNDILRTYDSGNVSILNGGELNLTGGTAYINADSGESLLLRQGTTTRVQVGATSGNVYPGADNTQTLGTTGERWNTVFSGTGGLMVTGDDGFNYRINVVGGVLTATKQ